MKSKTKVVDEYNESPCRHSIKKMNDRSHCTHDCSTASCDMMSGSSCATAITATMALSSASSPAPELIYESLNSTMLFDTDDSSMGVTHANTEETEKDVSKNGSSHSPCSVITTDTIGTIDSTSKTPQNIPNCDACPYCEDVCCTDYEEECLECCTKMAHLNRLRLYYRQQHQQQQKKNVFPFLPSFNKSPRRRIQQHHYLLQDNCSNKNRNNSDSTKKYIFMTKCQLKRYNNKQSGIYIQCNDEKIFDVTNYIDHHPGGINSILRKSGGGVDCTRDLNFHSPKAKALWKKFHVGYVVPCPGCHLDIDVNGNVHDFEDTLDSVDGDGDSPMDSGANGDRFNCSSQQEDCKNIRDGSQMELLDESKQCVIS